MVALDADSHTLIERFRIVRTIKVGRTFILERSRHIRFGRARNHKNGDRNQNSEASHEPLVPIVNSAVPMAGLPPRIANNVAPAQRVAEMANGDRVTDRSRRKP
jgi:hypothetical protein